MKKALICETGLPVPASGFWIPGGALIHVNTPWFSASAQACFNSINTRLN